MIWYEGKMNESVSRMEALTLDRPHPFLHSNLVALYMKDQKDSRVISEILHDAEDGILGEQDLQIRTCNLLLLIGQYAITNEIEEGRRLLHRLESDFKSVISSRQRMLIQASAGTIE